MHIPRRRFLQLAGTAAVNGIGVPRAFAQQAPAAFRCEIRTYHEIQYALFKRDLLSLLERGLQPVSIETIVGALNGSLTIPAQLPTFHVTWDDARLSQYTDGWRAIQDVQQARGVFIPVTAFLITKFDHLPVAAMADVPDDTPCYREDGNLPTNHRFMTKAQAIDLIRKGMHAGNHTVDHADLTALNLGAMEGELALAEQRIQGLWDLAGVSRPVKVFAYPYGHYNAAAIQTLQTLGYDAAFSTIPNALHAVQERWTLGRFGAPE